MSETKREARQRRAARGRALNRRDNKARLVAFRTGAHIYAQLITPDNRILTSASSVEKEMRDKLQVGNTVAAARAVGERLASKSVAAKFDLKVVFDRSGFKYHGRIKALAEGARAHGLEF